MRNMMGASHPISYVNPHSPISCPLFTLVPSDYYYFLGSFSFSRAKRWARKRLTCWTNKEVIEFSAFTVTVFTFEFYFSPPHFFFPSLPFILEHHRAAGQGRGRHGQDQRRDEGGRETHHRDGEMVRPLRLPLEQVTELNAFLLSQP